MKSFDFRKHLRNPTIGLNFKLLALKSEIEILYYYTI